MKYTLIILFSILFFSCITRKEKANSIVKQWIEKEIKFPSSINLTRQDSLWKLMINKEIKVLTVVDSNSCTECRLKLYDWRKYIEEIDSINLDITFIFIVHAKDSSLIEIIKEKNKFNYPIFYDYTNKMEQLNHFPKDSRFQTFLLDKNNKVILIGNPIGNSYMWKLYKKVFSEEVTTTQP